VHDGGGAAVVAGKDVEPRRQRSMAKGAMVVADAAQKFA
jgi:hypothetical protein